MSEPTAGVPNCYRHPDRESYIRCQRCERPICPDCMNEAAVGFQCPGCVAEGRRTVRQATTPYGGRPSASPAATTIGLIGINVAVWVGIALSGLGDSRLINFLALIPTGHCSSIATPGSYYPGIGSEQGCSAVGDGRWTAGVADGAYWQLITNVFTHVEPWHIGFNMFALWILGPQLERVLGRTRFLALYLVAGLAGSVTVLWLGGEHTTTLGASGAVFGLIGAMLVIGTKVGADMSSLWGLLAVNAVLTFVVPNVSWQGHLGGLVGGSLVAAILVLAPRQNRTAVQVAGTGTLVLALAAATLVRVAMLV